MADEEQQGGAQEKTEEPTQRRLQEAVKKGQVISSKEVTNFLMIVVLVFNIAWFLPYLMKRAVRLFAHFIKSPHDIILDNGGFAVLSWQVVGDLLSLISIPFITVVLAAFLSHFVQHGFIFTVDPILPKLEKISPLKGLQRMFSLRSLMEFIKGLIKITLVGVVAYMVVMPEIGRMEALTAYALPELMRYMGTLAFRMALGAAIVMAAIALLDYMYQRYEYMKKLRMSRQEMKEEYKQTEGDPVIKARLKLLRQEKARQRMMSSVPEASVVITNPTHYAVALKYDEDKMTAPILVAKGADAMALKIREVAELNKVPVVENPPLARSLYTTVDLDGEIPLEFYQAVAEVIGYVYRLKGKLPKKAAAKAEAKRARI
jgi:flagellar biosynthetic protein FlhB